MAHCNELSVDKSLIWKTEIPFEGRPRRSPNFWLLGSEWYLQFSYKIDFYSHVLSLHRATDGDEPLQTEFKVRTQLSSPTASDLTRDEVARQTSFIHQGYFILWRYAQNDDGSIFYILPSVRCDSEVQFVCRFCCQPPAVFWLQIASDLTVEKSFQVSSDVLQDTESLSCDFSHLLEKELFPDVRLECGGRTFRAHRSVLAARSRVFRAMFQNETLESETGTVKVQDVDVAILEKLLKFVYTGKLEDISEGNAADLYEAADQYDVPSLRTACACWILRQLAVENCVKYLVVADAHSDRDLKSGVVSFILENPSVLKSEAWITFLKEPSELVNEVFQAYIASTVQSDVPHTV